MKSEKQVAAEIRRRNKLFSLASESEKRVLVAKDVLALLKSKRVEAFTGNWVLPNCHRPVEDEASLQKELIRGSVSCSTCALGSIMVSLIAFKNQVTMREARYTHTTFDFGYMQSRKIDKPGLLSLFSPEQLKAIETAFECGEGYYSPVNGTDMSDSEKSILFGKRYCSPEDRLKAIMKNIVKNNGTFVP